MPSGSTLAKEPIEGNMSKQQVILWAIMGAFAASGAIAAEKKAKPAKAEAETKTDTKVDAKAKSGTAPDKFKLVFDTTKGEIVLDCDRSWAPKGADRLHELVQDGFFRDIALFRVVNGFVAQFGIHGDPKVSAKWRDKTFGDDPVKGSNTTGTLTFATAGKDTRTTQFFLNLADNKRLDQMGFAPICKVASGLDKVQKFYAEYGEGAPMGTGPAQDMIQMEGNTYLKKNFPKLDYIKSAKIKQ